MNDSGLFIEFTLSALYTIIAQQEKHQDKHQEEHQEKHQNKHQVDLTEVAIAILNALIDKTLSRKEIFTAIGMNSDSRSFKRNITPLINEGFVEMTFPDKPNSKLQKYRLTGKGAVVNKRKRR